MYLVELNSHTGLVKADKEFDGIMAIKEFRDVINELTLGIECFTAIALTADYHTPIGYYTEKDRPFKAMEIATCGNRRAFIWDQELIQVALLKYQDLQYNPVIEEKMALDQMLMVKLDEIKKAKKDLPDFMFLDKITLETIEEVLVDNNDVKCLLKERPWVELSELQQKSFIRKANTRIIDTYNQRISESESKKQEIRKIEMFKQLETIKKLLESFLKQNKDKDLFADGPVRNGYKLSRLEEKAEDKNSFYHKER